MDFNVIVCLVAHYLRVVELLILDTTLALVRPCRPGQECWLLGWLPGGFIFHVSAFGNFVDDAEAKKIVPFNSEDAHN